jgi:hypothetical protein
VGELEGLEMSDSFKLKVRKVKGEWEVGDTSETHDGYLTCLKIYKKCLLWLSSSIFHKDYKYSKNMKILWKTYELDVSPAIKN